MEAVKTKIPELRFPEFEGEWRKKKLGEISEKINSGKTPLGGESVYTKEGILFIRSQNVTDNKLSFENSTFITEKINDTMKNSVVKPKDVLLNITGASLGRSCVVPNDFTIGNVNQHVCIIRINGANEPRFIQPIFASQKGQNLFNSLQTGSGREGLNFQSIKQIKLYFPPLPEQQKIASFLTAVDDKIQQLTKKKSLLELYKKGVMQKIFSQQIRFKPALSGVEGDEDGKEFAEWSKRKIGEFVTERIDFPEKELSLYSLTIEKGVVPKSERYERSFLVNDTKNAYKRMCPDDFAFNPMNLRLGALARFKGSIDISVSKYYNIFYCNNKVNKIYMELFLTSYNMIQYYNKMATGSLEEKKRVHYLDFIKFKLLFPSIKEQDKIADFLTAIDNKIEHVNTQLNKTKAFKKALLQKMFV